MEDRWICARYEPENKGDAYGLVNISAATGTYKPDYFVGELFDAADAGRFIARQYKSSTYFLIPLDSGMVMRYDPKADYWEYV